MHGQTSQKNGEEDSEQVAKEKLPKVHWKVEYRDQNDFDVVYTDDVTDEDAQKRHRQSLDGPAFEVVDVYFTSERKKADSKKAKAKDNPEEKEPTVRPAISSKGHQFIRIFSTAIINAIQSVVNYYPGEEITGDALSINEPYAILVHHKDELQEFRERFNPANGDVDTRNCVVQGTYEDLGHLLDFLERKNGEQVRKEQARWNQQAPQASFEMLWLLLKPGIDVYFDLDDLGSIEPWVVSQVSFRILNGSWTEYSVTLWSLNSVGEYVEPRYRTSTVQHFHGERAIAELDIFPCQYLATHAKREAELIKRGKMFFHLRRKRCMWFDGKSSTFPQRHVSHKPLLKIKSFSNPISLKDM